MPESKINEQKILWFQNADIHIQEKNYSNAIQCIDKVIEINPDDVKALIILGIIRSIEKNFQESIRCLETASKINPNNFDIWCYLGFAYSKEKNFPEAIRCLNRGLGISQDNITAWMLLELAYFREKKFQEVVHCLDNELNSITDSPDKKERLIHFDRIKSQTNASESSKILDLFYSKIEKMKMQGLKITCRCLDCTKKIYEENSVYCKACNKKDVKIIYDVNFVIPQVKQSFISQLEHSLMDSVIEVEALNPLSVCRVSNQDFQTLITKFKIDQLFQVTSRCVASNAYETVQGFEIENSVYYYFYQGNHIFCTITDTKKSKNFY